LLCERYGWHIDPIELIYRHDRESIAGRVETHRNLARKGPRSAGRIRACDRSAPEGVYCLTEDERAAIREAQQTPFVADDEVDAYWKRYGIE
jgi:hypothetical protein